MLLWLPLSLSLGLVLAGAAWCGVCVWMPLASGCLVRHFVCGCHAVWTGCLRSWVLIPACFHLSVGLGPQCCRGLLAWLAVDCVLWLFVLREWALVFYACPCAFLCGFMCVFCACLTTLPCVLLCHVWPDSCCGGGLTGWCCGWLSGCPFAWLCLPLCFGL